MSPAFPEPTRPALDRREVLLGYLDYYRGVVLDRVASLDAEEATTSRLPTGWSPVELAHHLTRHAGHLDVVVERAGGAVGE